MSFLAPIPLGVIAWTAAVTVGLAALAYILKMRRRRFEVPFSTLWQRVLREKEATSLWKRLRRLLSLLLTLLVLGLLLLAATEPRLGAVDRDSRSVVILLDASASMKARDGGKDGATRMDAARAAARGLLEGMGGGDAAMVMRMDGQTTPLSRFESDMPRLTNLVGKVEASDTPADLRRALGAAADALRGRPNPMIILVGDGAYDPEALASVTWKKPAEALAPAAGSKAGAAPAAPAAAVSAFGKRLDLIDMSGIDVRYQPVGSSGENVGIIAFNARRYATDKTSYEVYIEVQNTGKRPARRKLVLYNGDLATDVRTLELNPGEQLRQIYSRGGGEDSVLRASLELEPPAGASTPAAGPPRRDVFPLDDQAWALLPARRKQHVLLVTKDNLYLEGAMLVYDNIEVDKLTPDEFEARLASRKLPDYAAVVFDDYTPAALPPPPANLLYFNPQGEHSPFRVRGSAARPHITEVNDNHPVMRWLVLNDVNFDSSSVFELDRDKGEVALASSVRDPIMAARRTADRKIVACSFSLASTDLMLRVAFPLFLVNTIDWFASDDADLLTTYATGTRARVPLDGVLGVSEVTVTAPSKRVSRAPLVEGQATFYASEVGVHVLRALDRPAAGQVAGRVLAEVSLAANLSSPTESNITPAPRLELGGAVLAAPEGFGISHPRSIWMYLVLLAAALLCAEWLTFNRRITV